MANEEGGGGSRPRGPAPSNPNGPRNGGRDDHSRGGRGSRDPEIGVADGGAGLNGAANPPIKGRPFYNIGLHPVNFPSTELLQHQGQTRGAGNSTRDGNNSTGEGPGTKPPTYSPGTISPIITANAPKYKTKWCYRFLFNPPELSWATRLNPQLTEDANITKLGLFSGQQAIQMELLVDRQADVAGYPGRSKDALRADYTLVRQLGTLYDLEWLYRVVNGDPSPSKAVEGIFYPTSDVGFLYTTSLLFNFGRALKFVGYINEFTVQHKMFSQYMIPTLSTITMGITRLTNTRLPAATTAPVVREEEEEPFMGSDVLGVGP